MATRFPSACLEELATRVLGGEVVFFVGSGFSLGAEDNSGRRLLGRVLARVLALALAVDPKSPGTAHQTLDGLVRTFGLGGGDAVREPARITTPTNLAKLVDNYYLFNDWSCSTLGRLLRAIEPVESTWWEDHVSRLEREFLSRLGTNDPHPLEPPRLRAFDADLETKLRGKALFLDTIGFLDPDQWGGDPTGAGGRDLRDSYGDRLRARHLVLAALAREGLANVLVTTNYDLLLEGAYRVAGMQLDEHASGTRAPAPSEIANALHRDVQVVADATRFFDSGTGFRSALLVKLHGCVRQYRDLVAQLEDPVAARSRTAVDSTRLAQHALSGVVYTFREIQNWREDDWSRDLMRTLLRTRTMAFVGYSGMDPVVHDTIRTVYEEMASRRASAPCTESKPRAFYFDVAGKREFYSREILNASGRAAGVRKDVDQALEFHVDGQSFPDLDGLLRWLRHRVVRQLQRRALDQVVARLGIEIWQTHRPRREYEAILTAFDDLCEREVEIAAAWSTTRTSRASFERVTSWTEQWVAPLMRTLAIRSFVQRGQIASLDAMEHAQLEWHCPLSDHPIWAAWSALTEIAVRRLVNAWTTNDDGDWTADAPRVRARAAGGPGVSFSTSSDPAPRRLRVRFDPFRDLGTDAIDEADATERLHDWFLRADHVRLLEVANERTPSARDLWTWAAAGLGSTARAKIGSYLGDHVHA